MRFKSKGDKYRTIPGIIGRTNNFSLRNRPDNIIPRNGSFKMILITSDESMIISPNTTITNRGMTGETKLKIEGEIGS